MTEPYTDEELAHGMRWEGTEEAEVQAFVNRMRATIMRLMDERHTAEARYQELRKTSIEKLRMDETARADRAEREVEQLEAGLVKIVDSAAMQRAQKAEALLAELVREVREWAQGRLGAVPGRTVEMLASILNKYNSETKP